MVANETNGEGRNRQGSAEKIADAEEGERMKAHWRERLTALKSQLEGGEIDA